METDRPIEMHTQIIGENVVQANVVAINAAKDINLSAVEEGGVAPSLGWISSVWGKNAPGGLFGVEDVEILGEGCTVAGSAVCIKNHAVHVASVTEPSQIICGRGVDRRREKLQPWKAIHSLVCRFNVWPESSHAILGICWISIDIVFIAAAVVVVVVVVVVWKIWRRPSIIQCKVLLRL